MTRISTYSNIISVYAIQVARVSVQRWCLAVKRLTDHVVFWHEDYRKGSYFVLYYIGGCESAKTSGRETSPAGGELLLENVRLSVRHGRQSAVTFRAIYIAVPSYLASDIQYRQPLRTLRSGNAIVLHPRGQKVKVTSHKTLPVSVFALF